MVSQQELMFLGMQPVNPVHDLWDLVKACKGKTCCQQAGIQKSYCSRGILLKMFDNVRKYILVLFAKTVVIIYSFIFIVWVFTLMMFVFQVPRPHKFGAFYFKFPSGLVGLGELASLIFVSSFYFYFLLMLIFFFCL